MDATNESGARATAREWSGPLALTALVVGLLALFTDKAFTVDDTLFLKLARQVLREPLDFYGFTVNWNGVAEPMHAVTKNPPLTGYWIAAAATLVGWSERALHATFLLPAAAVCAATWLLARRLCAHPLEAGLIGLTTPVFLVSSTNVMCDTTMLALWCWSIVCWMRGFDGGRRAPAWHAAAALLASLALLTKYFAIALVPLLLAYGLLRRRRPGAWLAWLALPLGTMAAYQWATHALYGRGLLLDAAEYARFQSGGSGGLPVQVAVGFVFAGGCLAPALLFAPLVFGRRMLGGMLAVAVLGLLPVVDSGALTWISWRSAVPAPMVLQMVAMAAGGVALLGLVAADWRRSRDADATLLALWVLGTFVFAALVNWVNNGRSNLPMAPALGILLVRRMDALALPHGAWPRRLALVIGALLGLGVAWADWRWAAGARSAAAEIAARFVSPERTTWFQGHWGFQHYMERAGARAFDHEHGVRPDDLIVIPTNNDLLPLDRRTFELVAEIERGEPRWIRTLSLADGAGFYASNLGPLPFAFGRFTPDLYRVWRVPGRRPEER